MINTVNDLKNKIEEISKQLIHQKQSHKEFIRKKDAQFKKGDEIKGNRN